MKHKDYTARRYFRLGGKSLEGVLAMNAQRGEVFKARKKFARTHGASELVTLGNTVAGLICKTPPDSRCWQPKTGEVDREARTWYVPKTRTKAGREVRSQMSKLNDVSGWDVNRALGVNVPVVPGEHGRGMVMRYAVPQKIGEVWYASVPCYAKTTPLDATEMKASEWYAMLEQQEAH